MIFFLFMGEHIKENFRSTCGCVTLFWKINQKYDSLLRRFLQSQGINVSVCCRVWLGSTKWNRNACRLLLWWGTLALYLCKFSCKFGDTVITGMNASNATNGLLLWKAPRLHELCRANVRRCDVNPVLRHAVSTKWHDGHQHQMTGINLFRRIRVLNERPLQLSHCSKSWDVIRFHTTNYQLTSLKVPSGEMSNMFSAIKLNVSSTSL